MVLLYVGVQISDGIVGAVLANTMFELPLIEFATTSCSGYGQCLAEVIATFGLIFVVFMGATQSPKQLFYLVGLYITVAYWFTPSITCENSAVTIAQQFSDTFSGIQPNDGMMFVLAQILGPLSAFGVCRFFFGNNFISKPLSAYIRSPKQM